MRHRVKHSYDLRQRLPEYAKELGVPETELEEAFQWMLENNVIFEEGEKEPLYSISSIDIEERISHPLAKRFFHRLKKDIPGIFVPLYGYNWPTFKERMRRVWEHTYNILINKIPSHNLRLWWLRRGGAKIGKGSSIWRNTEILGMENLQMGEDSVIAWHCQIDARAGLVIGDHVAIASHVLIVAGSHDLSAAEFWSISGPVYIEDYVWIASRALIGYGVRIGRGAVITANTVLAKDVAPYKIIGGSGARAMGERPHDLNYKVGGKGLFTLFH